MFCYCFLLWSAFSQTFTAMSKKNFRKRGGGQNNTYRFTCWHTASVGGFWWKGFTSFVNCLLCTGHLQPPTNDHSAAHHALPLSAGNNLFCLSWQAGCATSKLLSDQNTSRYCSFNFALCFRVRLPSSEQHQQLGMFGIYQISNRAEFSPSKKLVSTFCHFYHPDKGLQFEWKERAQRESSNVTLRKLLLLFFYFVSRRTWRE